MADIKLKIITKDIKISVIDMLNNIRSVGHDAWMSSTRDMREYESREAMKDKINYYESLLQQNKVKVIE